jgi:thiamine kinase-like enzyme
MIDFLSLNTYIHSLNYKTIQLYQHQSHDNIAYVIDNKYILKIPSSMKYINQVIKEKQLLDPIQDKNLCKPIKIFNINGINCGLYNKIGGTSLDRCKLKNNGKNLVAKQLAKILNKIHSLPTNLWNQNLIDQYEPGPHNFFRGGSIDYYSKDFYLYLNYVKKKNILSNKKIKKLNYLWQKALYNPIDSHGFIHGDIATGNIIYNKYKKNIHLIDFGCCGFGDKSCDLVMAFNYFCHNNRKMFFKIINGDKNLWIRSASWCIWKNLFEIYTKGQSIANIKIINGVLRSMGHDFSNWRF